MTLIDMSSHSRAVARAMVRFQFALLCPGQWHWGWGRTLFTGEQAMPTA